MKSLYRKNCRWLTVISLSLIICLFSLKHATAQSHAHIYMTDQNTQWNFPIIIDSIQEISLSDDLQHLHFNVNDEQTVPFTLQRIDSLTFEKEPNVETKDHYKVFQLYITTRDGSPINSKDYYKDCHISLNAQGAFSNYSANAQIRGRGNSTFLWYDKKPMRLKLNQKHKLLGLGKARSWVLLANYRDVTDIMNTFAFETGQWLGLPFTNHTRYVEVFLNGDYQGVYQLTEQVQQNKNRVNVSDDRGILLSLDVDDGPSQSPDAIDNGWTKVYGMPFCVKYPDDNHFTTNTVDSVRTVFAQLEQAIRNKDYEQVQQLLDIPSFIKYLQLQEFIYNVEISAPRSIFLHKDGDGPWVMGPLWDFDAGYDFDWGTMTTGHNFFSDYRETVMGTNPLKRNGQYNYVPQFFTDLFGCPKFVEEYKAHWEMVKDSIVSHGWTECMKYVEQLRASGTMEREAKRWPIRGKKFDTEVEKMHQWLIKRADFMTELIANIPVPDTTSIHGSQLCGTMQVPVTMQRHLGYNQDVKIHVDSWKVLDLIGVAIDQFKEPDITIVPLNKDGSEGPNKTNGIFGGWFNDNDEPQDWYHGHVYIEVFSDLWNWNCGVHPDNCYDDSHTVTMQIQYPHEGILKKVNIEVNFTIESGGWWW